MIKQFKLIGFQSHLRSVLKLSKGVNIIIGSSDSGKSALIRAIRWVCHNRPQSNAFKNINLKPSEYVRGKIQFINGVIVRQKNKTTNSYLVNNTEYKALRSDVPKEVQAITNIKEFNIQSQHPNDQYFLLGDTPGRIAKKFNDVSGLHKMDQALLEIKKNVRSCKQQISFYDDEIEERQQQITRLNWIKQAKIDADKINQVLVNEQKEQQTATEITKTLSKLNSINDLLADYRLMNKAMIEYDKLYAKEQEQKELYGTIETLTTLINDLSNINFQLKQAKSFSSALQKANLLLASKTKIKEQKKNIANIINIKKNITNVEAELSVINIDITKLTKQFNKYLKTNKCPICGRK